MRRPFSRGAAATSSRAAPTRRSSTPTRRSEDEDVHAFVERELVARIGDAGRRLHTGRSRNEQVAVDLRLYLKRRVPELQQAIGALIARSRRRAPSAPARR